MTLSDGYNGRAISYNYGYTGYMHRVAKSYV